MIWFDNVRSNKSCLNDGLLIEKGKHFGGELTVTEYSHFFEKKYCVVLTGSIIRKIQ